MIRQPRWRRAVVTVVLLPALGALSTVALGAPLGASTPNTATLRFTVPTPVVLNVEHLMSVVHRTTSLHAIWANALCDAPTEPIPRQVTSSGATANFQVTMLRSRLRSVQKVLRQIGCGTLLGDYQSSLGRYAQRLAQETSTP